MAGPIAKSPEKDQLILEHIKVVVDNCHRQLAAIDPETITRKDLKEWLSESIDRLTLLSNRLMIILKLKPIEKINPPFEAGV